VAEDGHRLPGAIDLLEDGLHGRFGAQSIGVDRAAGEQDRMVVLWIGVIQRLVDGERQGRLKIVLDGLDLTGLIESSPVRAPASRSALTDSASSGSSISSVASMAIRRLSSVGTVILP
jgi:hypothetical protein